MWKLPWVIPLSIVTFAAALAPIASEARLQPAYADPSSPAATFTVTATADALDADPGDGSCATAGGECTLRAAIQEANALSGEDEIVLPAGVFAITRAGRGEDAASTGDLDVTSRMTIRGAGRGSTVVDGNSLDRVFHVASVGNLTLRGLTVREGRTLASTGTPNGGGILGGQVTLENVELVDNVAEIDTPVSGGMFGGGAQATTMVVRDSLIRRNRVLATTDSSGGPMRGGGLSAVTLQVENSSIEENSVDTAGTAQAFGGGIFALDLSMADSTVRGNEIRGTLVSGGGVYADDPVISTSLFHANTATGTSWSLGGAVAFARGEGSVRDSTFTSNEATGVPFGLGGAISTSSNLEVTRTLMEANQAAIGGALEVEIGAVVTVSESWIRSNSATFGGGGIGVIPSSRQTTVEIRSSVVKRNESAKVGGGVSLAGGSAADSARLVVVGSEMSENVAGTFGGAIALLGGGSGGPAQVEAEVRASTISSNVANNGGGVSDGPGKALLVDTTVTRNTARSSGGGIWSQLAPSTLDSSVVAGQAAGADCAGAKAVSVGHSADSDGSCLLEATGDRSSVDTKLARLEFNGGVGRSHHPAASSPLLAAGSPSCGGAGRESDQRGVSRPRQFRCEIGAVEALAQEFSDVTLTNPFYGAISWSALEGLVLGFADGTFRPLATLRRQELVGMLWRLEGSPTGYPDPGFSDVDGSNPFFEAVAWAAAEEVVLGFSDGTFQPTRKVARQEFTALLWRLAGSPRGHADPGFSDVDGSNPFFEAVAWAAAEDVVAGYADGTFLPRNAVNRQETTQLVVRFDTIVRQAPGAP
ncbi:MAG: hypothetical protein KatS3mg008_0523 [Acidimicrobiales bacterium]|nr:MAG: hypothetical protein KatS3mg008_0523 [Acidimicrobiales bacterium]